MANHARGVVVRPENPARPARRSPLDFDPWTGQYPTILRRDRSQELDLGRWTKADIRIGAWQHAPTHLAAFAAGACFTWCGYFTGVLLGMW